MKKIFLGLLACTGLIGMKAQNNFGYPLVPDMIADASINVIDDTFYCYATTDGYGRGLETSGPPVVWKSKDFVHWSFNGTYFPSAENEKYWAPSKVTEYHGKYYIYPTINGYMYTAVADSPEGPFRLAVGPDRFDKPFTKESTLLKCGDRRGIDAEIFIESDNQPYVFWQMRHASKLGKDMMTVEDENFTIETKQKEYSEGPIFFKRKGIYYYLYTIGGDEKYQYYYMMSRTSPLGPYEAPENDLVCTTNRQKNVYGPGHGCVFTYKGKYYLAYLEFGRRSTNRQTYVNELKFNDDGTIRLVDVDLNGVGALRRVKYGKQIPIVKTMASSQKDAERIKPMKDKEFNRTEFFLSKFVADGSNGSRWMAAANDEMPTFVIDLGKKRKVGRSEICFVRPTAGHSYALSGSDDMQHWTEIAVHDQKEKRSPQVDAVNASFRYLKVKITDGEKGIWQWNVYK